MLIKIEDVKYTVHPYSTNTIENINELVKVFNFFKDPTKSAIDYSDELPNLTGIPYPDNCCFGISFDKNNITINDGRCFINTNFILSREETLLNLNRKKDYLIDPSTWSNSTIPISDSFVTYIVIKNYGVDKDHFIGYYIQDYENIKMGLIERIDYINNIEDIQNDSILIGILEYDRDDKGRVDNVELKFEDSIDNTIFVTFLEPEIYIDEVDGGILKK